ncbi:prepilin-type N-terminal cleavage/methylation domain protein [Asticcacaulis biprosthecium C19]|uniref:Prepilin-type N-terminal cleavage/methylation domain protein n=1 Tax=Asticcacaulis biprosthecium C19 TaxID=715226 RepID=F4QHW9_9CAUL|nr:hypothetical protein [Asticcacaulis biprosthecium]EGF92856.1 prepilin-type N-terminal cleavage/methylation domain protein [Asticcacaulis biprosthecium C19]
MRLGKAKQKEGGFTLAEAVMALLVVSLAMAGLMQVNRMIAQGERRGLADRRVEASRRSFVNELRQTLTPLQPLRDAKVSGDAEGLSYPCANGECALRPPNGRLVYLSEGAVHTAWPPAPVSDQPPPRLSAVLWQDGDGKNLATVKFPVEHEADCLFDMISRTCLQPQSSASAS